MRSRSNAAEVASNQIFATLGIRTVEGAQRSMILAAKMRGPRWAMQPVMMGGKWKSKKNCFAEGISSRNDGYNFALLETHIHTFVVVSMVYPTRCIFRFQEFLNSNLAFCSQRIASTFFLVCQMHLFHFRISTSIETGAGNIRKCISQKEAGTSEHWDQFEAVTQQRFL